MSLNIPGITQLQTDRLTELELQALLNTKTELEKEILLFANDRPQLLPNQEQKLQNITQAIQKLTNIAPLLNKNVRIEIKGHADSDGTVQHNLQFSQARANTILSALSRQIEATYLTAIGVGANEPWQQDTDKNKGMNRRVSFKVVVTNAP